MASPFQFSTDWSPLIDGVSIIAVVAGVAKAFEWFDKMVNEEGREALRRKLRNIPTDERIESWATVFSRLIDSLFGPKALSWRFFVRSLIASFIAVFLVTLLYFRVHSKARATPDFVLICFLGAAIANGLPDYLSLLVSRMIVKLMARRLRGAQVLFLLVADVFLTGLVALLSEYLSDISFSIIFIFQESVREHTTPLRIFAELHIFANAYWNMRMFPWWNFKTSNGQTIFFYSAFFTSVWVWLYVVALFLITIIHKIRAIWIRVVRYIDIEKKPLIAIGRVAGLLAGVGYAIIVCLIWSGHYWRAR